MVVFATLWLLAIAWLAWLVWSAPDAKDVLPHARKCSWCGQYGNDNDRWLAENGALITHGMCDDCASKQQEK